jgi:isocitrate dehydrogenase kinase/phosphatase
VLSSLFFRNKGAYVVGKIINGFTETPFALPIVTRAKAASCDRRRPVRRGRPAARLQLRPRLLHGGDGGALGLRAVPALAHAEKPRSEIYSAIGLQKQGKNIFYRDFLMHTRHSSDKFRIAPGIKGMVMLVFDLPSFPFVFKVIKDFYPAQKDTTREKIKGKYLLVKQHDRVGRMADTLEYSNVAFPRERFEPELIAELPSSARACSRRTASRW